MLPFSAEQFFALFERYNLAIWPAQLVAYSVAGSLVWSIVTRRTLCWRMAASILGALWLWNGLVYHLAFFTAINSAASWFAVLFVVQGLFLIGAGLRKHTERIVVEWDSCTVIAAGLILYAMLVYNVIGILIGHGWPRAPMFGVAPCPTTIFTFGILVLARRAASPWLAAIPIVWALTGSTAAIFLGVWEDLGLLIAAATLLASHHVRRRA